jgi:CRISPR/Cas system CMR-associated protein Cmr1 (group 7 of RAMP superfamily)
MGKSFFPYDPHYNNCQDFILGVLDGNKLTTPDVRDFVKQDTGQLFANNKALGTIAKGVTSFGGFGERLIHGYGYKNISSKKYNMKYNYDSDSGSDSESDGEEEIINKIRSSFPVDLNGKILKTTVKNWETFGKVMEKNIFRSFSVTRDGEDLYVYFL